MNSLIDCLDHWSQKDPQRVLFTFLDIHGQELDSCTYGSFQKQTNFMSATLTGALTKKRGRRVLLSYPPGLDMIKAFVACVKLGVVPVPVPPIRQSAPLKDMAKLNAIAIDSGAIAVLTDQKHQEVFLDHLLKQSKHLSNSDLQSIKSLAWIATDSISGELESFRTKENKLLFLQYTSGSTRAPKGVMVTHQNVLHNCHDIRGRELIAVSWLPHYHDMGFIGYYLFVIVTGGTTHNFSALDFMRRPALWLETITRVRATNTSAPNFAFDYCLRQDKLPDTALDSIDLSSMQNMMNASEPVHCSTVRRFQERFEPYGLSRTALTVAYGLAEHTLWVSGDGNTHIAVNKERLARGQPFMISGQQYLANAVSLPSVGKPLAGVDLRIVNPDTLIEKPDGSTGEIWVDSPSKAQGYWGQQKLSEDVFHAGICGAEHKGTYLRTGDIGFFHEGELYFCGRIGDMIVIRGRNIFPPDIEAAVESHFPEVEPGRVVAFGMPSRQNAESGLVVLIEARNVNHAPNPQDVHKEIVNTFQVPVIAVAISRRGVITRTTSGKIARHACRSAFMQDRIALLDIYEPTLKDGVKKSFEEYLDWLVGRGGEDVSGSVTIAELGLDSLELVELGLLLEKSVGREVLPDTDHSSLIYDLRLLQSTSISELRLLHKRLRSGRISMQQITSGMDDAMQSIVQSEAEQMRIDSKLKDSCIPVPYPATSPKRTILLTGATGFLGSFLLEALLRLSRDPVVVLVRAQNDEHARLRVETALAQTSMDKDGSRAMHTRIQVLRGDVALGNLGLERAQWDFLSGNITTIYHCAAEVDYLKTYRELRASNVAGTSEIIRLCCKGQAKELNFISTTFIFGWKTKGRKKENHRNAGMEGLDFGYSQSKWVAEQLVYEAKTRGLRARVFRPSLIGASESGHFIRRDITTRVLGYMVRQRVSIDSQNQVSLLPVDICANNIVAIALLDDYQKSTFHLTAGSYYSISTVCRHVTELFGYEFSYTDTNGFIDHINQHCTSDDDLFPLVAFFNNNRENFRLKVNERYENACYTAYCDKTSLSKPEQGLKETVAWIVSFLISADLIHPPVRLPHQAKDSFGQTPVA